MEKRPTEAIDEVRAWLADNPDDPNASNEPAADLARPVFEWMEELEQRINNLLLSVSGAGRACSCGERIFFLQNRKGSTVPYTRYGLNHFIDCPEREKHRKAKP